jgi:hypothetical protein
MGLTEHGKPAVLDLLGELLRLLVALELLAEVAGAEVPGLGRGSLVLPTHKLPEADGEDDLVWCGDGVVVWCGDGAV